MLDPRIIVMPRSGSEPWFDPEPVWTEPRFRSRPRKIAELNLRFSSGFRTWVIGSTLVQGVQKKHFCTGYYIVCVSRYSVYIKLLIILKVFEWLFECASHIQVGRDYLWYDITKTLWILLQYSVHVALVLIQSCWPYVADILGIGIWVHFVSFFFYDTV